MLFHLIFISSFSFFSSNLCLCGSPRDFHIPDFGDHQEAIVTTTKMQYAKLDLEWNTSGPNPRSFDLPPKNLEEIQIWSNSRWEKVIQTELSKNRLNWAAYWIRWRGENACIEQWNVQHAAFFTDLLPLCLKKGFISAGEAVNCYSKVEDFSFANLSPKIIASIASSAIITQLIEGLLAVGEGEKASLLKKGL